MLMSDEYKQWLKELKSRIRQSQLKAAVKVNTELLKMYWEMGRNIVERQKNTDWGDSFLTQLSKDLISAFPDMKGFSISNLKYIRQWYLFYEKEVVISQQLVGQLGNGDSGGQNNTARDNAKLKLLEKITNIPWGHNILIVSKCQSVDEALFYVGETVEYGWSRNFLLNMLETGLYEAKGKALTNFKRMLPTPMSDLAQQTLKDPYCFDFLALREDHDERELEEAIVANITRFLLELGNGFAYVGRQYRLQVGEDEFRIDLLFYHLKLHSYIVVELKNGKFRPEYLGKLAFYVEAVDRQLKLPEDSDTIGLLICKDKNKITAEYSLSTTNLPLGISEYEISKFIPEKFKFSLPTIEEIEKELGES